MLLSIPATKEQSHVSKEPNMFSSSQEWPVKSRKEWTSAVHATSTWASNRNNHLWHIRFHGKWKMVAQDLFTMALTNYLVTVDCYSEYWELDRFLDTTSQTVIECTKANFAWHGIPETVITDNRPQLISREYEKCATERELQHTITSRRSKEIRKIYI